MESKIVELTPWEIAHIKRALQEKYNEEWCSVCESIAEKLCFELTGK